MKKILLAFLCLYFFKSQAITWSVNVSSNQFSPASLNVKIGDVVHWVWVSGNHTTTSLLVPAGAASWDGTLNTAGDVFDYPVTATGSYFYQCDIHPAQMQGTITATAVTPVTLSVFNMTRPEKSCLVNDDNPFIGC